VALLLVHVARINEAALRGALTFLPVTVATAFILSLSSAAFYAVSFAWEAQKSEAPATTGGAKEGGSGWRKRSASWRGASGGATRHWISRRVPVSLRGPTTFFFDVVRGVIAFTAAPGTLVLLLATINASSVVGTVVAGAVALCAQVDEEHWDLGSLGTLDSSSGFLLSHTLRRIADIPGMIARTVVDATPGAGVPGAIARGLVTPGTRAACNVLNLLPSRHVEDAAASDDPLGLGGTAIAAYVIMLLVSFVVLHRGSVQRGAAKRMQALRGRRLRNELELGSHWSWSKAEDGEPDADGHSMLDGVAALFARADADHARREGSQRRESSSPVERPDPELARAMTRWYTVQLATTGADMGWSGLFGLRLDKRRYLARSAVDTPLLDDVWVSRHAAKDKTLPFRFDFFADTGDGFNSTYTIMRALAQPSVAGLPRPPLVVFGGDLVYPHPTLDNFRSRVLFPLHSALLPGRKETLETLGAPRVGDPPDGDDDDQATGSAESTGTHEWGDRPEMLLLPGNHDWIDGLMLFQSEILDAPGNLLAGWQLTQTGSYFARRFPCNWVLFSLDTALADDIDAWQFQRFCRLAAHLAPEDRVIILTHVPVFWESSITDESERPVAPAYVRVMRLARMLGPRCRMLLSGDVHNMIHYVPEEEATDADDFAPHLVVCGGGGAFLHPTHLSRQHMEWQGGSYTLDATFPTQEQSAALSWRNLYAFRDANLAFDLIGAAIYVMLVISLVPTCRIAALDTAVTQALEGCVGVRACTYGLTALLVESEWYLLQEAIFSPIAALILVALSIAFVPPTVPMQWRVVAGTLHAGLHQVTAVAAHAVVAVVAAYMSRNPMPTPEEAIKLFPTLGVFLSSVDSFTSNAATWLLTSVMSMLDVYSTVVGLMECVCSGCDSDGDVGTGEVDARRIHRYGLLLAFVMVYSLLILPVAARIFGFYLFVCDRLGFHWDETFSALACEDYKSFLRCEIDQETKELIVRVLGIEHVPRLWKADPRHDEEARAAGDTPPWRWDFPSKWVPDEAEVADGRTGEMKVVHEFRLQ
jgi:hypothetical protein